MPVMRRHVKIYRADSGFGEARRGGPYIGSRKEPIVLNADEGEPRADALERIRACVEEIHRPRERQVTICVHPLYEDVALIREVALDIEAVVLVSPRIPAFAVDAIREALLEQDVA